jgi:hypothetical protein
MKMNSVLTLLKLYPKYNHYSIIIITLLTGFKSIFYIKKNNNSPGWHSPIAQEIVKQIDGSKFRKIDVCNPKKMQIEPEQTNDHELDEDIYPLV